ncbi:hypothetical protein BDV59DRAFT_200288 [Aspergillus ambiguus]|uniref:uncharacterized protein n=1 Tax=Aspergillus ambiguus TaxID=176160 RepID=UPI003CCD2097
MLDENLPTFFLKSTKQKHLWNIFLTQHGNEPAPVYALRHLDPTSPESKNRYAVALADPFVPDVIYGEVLLIPEWTQPSLSADAIRQNGGVTPPPEPLLPTRFTVHLYNPDQQITVTFKPKTWNSPATWSFEMPQHTFRQPSSSALDHTQSDPAAADTTPKLRFSWRRDSKLSKDLTCLLLGKTSSLSETKPKHKEPDITVSIFQALRELTLYEPNLYRVEMEDFKGLEVVLLLGAVTIRDVYFTPMKESFHLTKSAPSPTPSPVAAASAAPAKPRPDHEPPTVSGALGAPSPDRRKQDLERKEEEKRTKKLLEEEDKARRKRQADVDKETRRLQKIYGQEEQKVRQQTHSPALPPRPMQPPRPHPTLPLRPSPAQPHHHYSGSMPQARPRPGPYLSVPGNDGRRQSSLGFVPMRPQSTGARPPGPTLQPKKSSFFGFRKTSEEAKLSKKRSSMF